MNTHTGTILDVARACLDEQGDATCLWYRDLPIPATEVARRTAATAKAMADAGVRPGDRVALMVQNSPEFVVVALATWHLGAILVTVNPMLKTHELRSQLDDCSPTLLVCLADVLDEVCLPAVEGSSVRSVFVADATARTRNDPPAVRSLPQTVSHDGVTPPRAAASPDDVAVLIYTSGTTGPAKGAMLTHRNLLSTAAAFNDVVALDAGDRILALAPLFHVTGLVLHVVLAFVVRAPLVLMGRFEPALARQLLLARRPTFTIAAITAYVAMLDEMRGLDEDLSFLRCVYTGGAPVSEATVREWTQVTGRYLHNAYGLSESSAPCVAVPLGETAPVDPRHGALSIGKALPGMTVAIRLDDGTTALPNELGEIVVHSPGVTRGYWNKPDETALVLGADGFLRTGDVGFVDEQGWVFLVDRKKDLIIASGYKVWPRDVEDVLYLHPGVLEAAVVGVPDDYRGETVRAYVSPRPGMDLDPGEVIDFCRPRMAAYKRPREVVVMPALPKTQSGKIMRRALRA